MCVCAGVCGLCGGVGQVRDGPVQVEVSIGNYGNVNEGDVAPGSSVTVATTAVSDGSNYWYLSWEDKKPLLELTSQWEDIEYRVTALNGLRAWARQLTPALAQLRQWLYEKDPAAAAPTHVLVHEAVARFARTALAPMPELPAAAFTKLDYHLRELRDARRAAIAESARTCLAVMQVGRAWVWGLKGLRV